MGKTSRGGGTVDERGQLKGISRAWVEQATGRLYFLKRLCKEFHVNDVVHRNMLNAQARAGGVVCHRSSYPVPITS